MFYLVKCYKNTSFVGVIAASGHMVKFILGSIMSNTTLNLVAILKTAKPCKNFSYKFLISKLLANSFDASIGPLNRLFFAYSTFWWDDE